MEDVTNHIHGDIHEANKELQQETLVSSHPDSKLMKKVDTSLICSLQQARLPTGREYQYQSLPPGRYVRLLELHPGIGNDPLEATLRCVNLDSNPVYSAISYEWGSFTALKEIKIGSQMLTIRANLHFFLKLLRHRRNRRCLWVDAISINQRENSERGHQVRLMSSIYSQATQVLVWLGSGLEQVRMAIRILKSTMLVASVGHDQVQRCLKSFLGLRYWTRTWIVQEIVLAKKPVLFYDKLWLEWSQVERLHEALVLTPQAGHKSLLQMQPMRLVRQRSSYAKGALLLSDLLETHFSSACTEPRDKVYGMLGLARDYQTNPSFDIDYKKDMVDLFREVMCFCAVSNLEVVRFAYLLQRSLGIVREADNSNVIMNQLYFAEETRIKAMWYQRRRSGKGSLQPQISGPHFLPCEGVCLGSVYDADIPTPSAENLLYRFRQLVWHRQDGILSESWTYVPSKEDILSMCRKAAYQASLADAPLFQDIEADCQALQTLVASWESNAHYRDSVSLKGLDSLRLEQVGLKFVFLSLDVLSSTVITLGLAPRHARSGDMVVYFHGYQRLFFADSDADSPTILGPMMLPERCGVSWDEVDALYLKLLQWEERGSRTSQIEVDERLFRFFQRKRRFMMSLAEVMGTFY